LPVGGARPPLKVIPAKLYFAPDPIQGKLHQMFDDAQGSDLALSAPIRQPA